jgi:hypothetical protein
VVLRGPLRWFFKGRIKRHVPPWLVALTAGILAFIGVAFWLWTQVSLKVLMGLGAFVALMAIIIAGAYAYDRDPKHSKQIAKWGTLPIWLLPYLLVKTAKWVWKYIEKPFNAAAGVFIYGIRWPWLNPAAFTVIGGLAAFAYFNTEGFLKLLMVVGTVVGILIGLVVLAVVLVMGGEGTKDWWTHRSRETWIDHLRNKMSDTVKLGATYVSTKKRGSRICPFIEFEE